MQLDKLRPHQHGPAKRLLDILTNYPSAVDFSDTGTGKTYVAAAVANALKLPTLVVVPKVAITAWERAAQHFDDSFSVINYEMLRTGRTPYGKWENNPPVDFKLAEFFKCQCCQLKFSLENFTPCYCHPLGIHCAEIKRAEWKYGKFNFHPAVRHVIFDEVHRCGGLDSLNAELLIGSRRQKIKTLGLSATAACSPLGMRALGFSLDIHTLDYDIIGSGRKNFYSWAYKYGVRRDPAFKGLVWRVAQEKQLGIMAEIRDSIIPARGVRVRVEDIPGFPERDITSELYDLDEHGQIDRLYNEMADPLARLAERSLNDSEHPLTEILRARQKIELLKVPIAVELARDYVAKGHSVGIFVNFTETLTALREKLGCDCFIDGTPAGVKYRQRSIDSFQADTDRIILANSEAGGICVSLHDLRGFYPRVGLVFPSFSAVTMKQVFGRFHRDGGLSRCFYRILFAAKTVEEKVHRALKPKLNNLDALNDADLMPQNLILTKSSILHTNRV